MKFGYQFKSDQASLKLRTYMGAALPPPPVSVDWTLAISTDIGMDGNDSVGCCTAADVAHTVLLLTAMGSGIVVPTAPETIAFYSGYSGYIPGDDSTDRGASLSEAANFAQTHGFMVGGVPHKIHAYLDLDPDKIEQYKQAIYLFKHASIGFNVPDTAIDDFKAGRPWTDYSGKIVGGHDVPLVAYDDFGPTCMTWGGYQKMSWDFLLNTVQEAQARLYDDAAGSDWNDANGFSFSQLEADLAAVTGG